MLTGAEDVDELTHVFVLKGPALVYAMLEGVKGSETRDMAPVSIESKCIENRQVRFSPGWYGVILGKGTDGVTREQYEEVVAKLPGMSIPPWGSKQLWEKRGCVVGVVKIEHSLPYELCKHSEWANGARACNIISQAGWLSEAVPCRGNFGVTPITDRPTLDRVRELATIAKQQGKIYATGGEVKFPYKGPEVWPSNKKRKGAIDLNDCDEVAEMLKFVKRARARLVERASQAGSSGV